MVELQPLAGTVTGGIPLSALSFISLQFRWVWTLLTSSVEIIKLSKRLQIRQQALGTAQLYIRRFYSKVEIRKTNPYLVLVTAVYLACKMEECTHHIRIMVTEARAHWPGKTLFLTNGARLMKFIDFISNDASKIGECEFFLISEMGSQMIVHHPYRSLMALQTTFSLSPEESTLAWTILNDHYMTDLPLLYAPHLIALTAMLLALVLRPNTGNNGISANNASNVSSAVHNALNSASSQARSGTSSPGAAKQTGPAGPRSKISKLSSWLAESNIDIEGLVDCTQEIISFYEVLEQYNEKLCKEQIHRFIKARGLDK